MSTTAMRISAARAAVVTAMAAASASQANFNLVISILEPPSILERAPEREVQQALLIMGLGVERLRELDPQRPDRREPAHSGAGGQARLVPGEALVGGVGVAGIGEHDALETDALHDGEDDLVIDDGFLVAADRRRRDHLPVDVLPRLARTERARLEAADRADPAREVALEERERILVDAAVAEEAVAERPAERIGEVTDRLRVQERVVPALARFRLQELLAAEPRD